MLIGWVGYSDFEEQPFETLSCWCTSCELLSLGTSVARRADLASLANRRSIRRVRPLNATSYGQAFSLVGHLRKRPIAGPDPVLYKCAQRLSDRPHGYRVQTGTVDA
jgi:hypothetical protein